MFTFRQITIVLGTSQMRASFQYDPDQLKQFKFEATDIGADKKVQLLARTDRLVAAAQILKRGGENNLHSHSHLDGFWFVLKGRARFYSDLVTVAAEICENEGVLVPRGVKYWFESIGDEPLHLLQVECSDVAMPKIEQLVADRKDFSPPKREISINALDEKRG